MAPWPPSGSAVGADSDGSRILVRGRSLKGRHFDARRANFLPEGRTFLIFGGGISSSEGRLSDLRGGAAPFAPPLGSVPDPGARFGGGKPTFGKVNREKSLRKTVF